MKNETARGLEGLGTTHASNPTVCADGGTSWSELTSFQRDLLEAIVRLERDNKRPYGQAIKNLLESRYPTEINHGRLYPNLDTLATYGLVEKERKTVDDRTNDYRISDEGEALLIQQTERMMDACELFKPPAVADGGSK